MARSRHDVDVGLRSFAARVPSPRLRGEGQGEGQRRVGGLIARLLFLLMVAGPTAAVAAALPPVGASSCSGCHAASKSVETPVPPLAGRNPADIEAAMRDFRSGKRPASVMDRIAKGFSDDEVTAIAKWYAAQQP